MTFREDTKNGLDKDCIFMTFRDYPADALLQSHFIYNLKIFFLASYIHWDR
jgi:hypothetical protein